jgi:hypothetical protein
MAEFGNKIKRATKGDAPSLVDADYANDLIDAINALQRITIQSAEEHSVEYSKEGVVFFIKTGETGETIIQSTGGGLPEGFTEQEMTICENGGVSSKLFLMKDNT